MGSVLNGLAAHGGLRGFGATFLVFSDYMRPAVRLAAIMGDAGQLRLDARLGVARRGWPDAPADRARDVAAADPEPRPASPLRRQRDGAGRGAWPSTRTDGPTGLQLSRQGAADARRDRRRRRTARGAYVLAEAEGALDAIVIATGSEVHDALAARDTLPAEGVGVRVVSMPSWDLFAMQDAAYRDAGAAAGGDGARLRSRRASPSAGSGGSATRGRAIGIDRFGASAPGQDRGPRPRHLARGRGRRP